jgi:hypothetical protein
MTDIYDAHIIIEETAKFKPERSAMLFYLWFKGRFYNGASFKDLLSNYPYNPGERQLYRYLEELSAARLITKKRDKNYKVIYYP